MSCTTDVIQRTLSKQVVVLTGVDAQPVYHYATNTAVIIAGIPTASVLCSKENQVVVTYGGQGASGADGLMSEGQVVDLIKDTLHANSSTDGIEVASDGNIRMSIGTLQSIP